MNNEKYYNDLAIIGMACRFPGANNLRDFWENLCAGRESIKFFSPEELNLTDIDVELLNSSNYVLAAPILDNVEKFDAEFFEYSPKEARLMDPQHRFLLEVAWEAFEDAGYSIEQKLGTVGTFTGSGGVVTSYLSDRLPHHPDLLGATGSVEHLGNDKDFLSTRIAYKLNLTGPSINVQTACSTSLVATHLACQSIINAECDLALVGVSTMRFPHYSGYLYSKGNILSPDGHCRPFDANAQGTVFGSGVAAILLKRVSAAIVDKDHIYAVIKSTAINNDGALKISYTASGVDGQAGAIRSALQKAAIHPQTIGYVECHGTGTLMGDPIEINALNKVFSSETKRKQYCPIGSIKGNIGHLEQTAGLAGLIKTALIIKYGLIPPSINYDKPNPKISFAKTPFYVNTTLSQWNDNNPRRACVNSLGLGGTNAFIVLEQAPEINSIGQIDPIKENFQLLNLSAKNAAALFALKRNYLDFLNQYNDDNLKNICYTANVGRVHFPVRSSYIITSVDELKKKITVELDKQEPLQASISTKPKIAFLFTGQGSQYPNMSRELYEIEPVFRSTLKRCEKILTSYLDEPLLAVLYDDKKNHLLNETLYTQPALFSLEYSLTELWRSWGIKPTAVMGHSVGEYVAACVAGVYSLEDSLCLIAKHARLMHELPQTSLLDPMLSSLTEVAKSLKAHAPKITWISNLTGEIKETVPNPEYWAENARHPVLFQKSFLLLDELGINTFLEIGPGKALINLGKSILQDTNINWLVSLSRNESDQFQCLTSLQKLYLAGCTIDFAEFYRDKNANCLSLPLYPFQRKRYWLENKVFLTKPNLTKNILHPFLNENIQWSDEHVIFELNFSIDRFNYLNDHRIFNTTILPTTAGLEFLSVVGEQLLGTNNLVVENLIYEKAINLDAIKKDTIRCFCQKQNLQQLQINLSSGNDTSQQINYLSASISINSSDLNNHAYVIEEIKQKCPNKISSKKFYATIDKFGLNYGPSFQGIQSVWLGENKALSRVELTSLLQDPTDEAYYRNYIIQPAFLDACLHIYPMLLEEYRNMDKATGDTKIYLPIGIERFYVIKQKPQKAWVYVELQEVTNQGLLVCNITLLDDNSQLIASIERLTLRKLSVQELIPTQYVDHLYQLFWQQLPVLMYSSLEKNLDRSLWLIFANDSNQAQCIRDILNSKNQLCYHILPGNAYSQLSQYSWTINSSDPDDFKKILQNIASLNQLPLKGIIYTASVDSPNLINDNEIFVCRSALYLTQALVDSNSPFIYQTNSPRLWFITNNGQLIPEFDQDVDLIQAELWGLGRTIAVEYPNMWGGIIDCPKADEFSLVNEIGYDVLKEICDETTEQQIVLRSKRRFASRLIRVKDEIQQVEKNFSIKENASYLITGGLGALGLCMAKWLVSHCGAKHLILTNRSGINSYAALAIQELKSKQVEVIILNNDLGVEEEVQNLFATIRQSMPPLRGIIHCAGALDDAVIEQMSWDKFSKITRAKVTGSFLLHNYSRNFELDFFILFSSILSLMGSPGQINYTAGNAFQDALGALRRAQGLPSLIMNWGPWAEIGLATHSREKGEAIWRKRGTQYIKPEEAIRLLNDAIRLNLDHAAVTITDWNVFTSQFNKIPSLYSSLTSAVSSHKTDKNLQQMRAMFLNCNNTTRMHTVLTILDEIIKHLLELTETINPHKSLNELGLDSLIAIELINQIELIFNIRIPAMKIIQGANITNIAEEIIASNNKTEQLQKNQAHEISSEKSDWFVFFNNNTKKNQHFLFCFPYAGGSPSIFKNWAINKLKNIQIAAIHLPGRGVRLSTKPYQNITSIAKAIVDAMLPYLDISFSMFGHSMGGLIMYEVVLLLQKLNLPLPQYLFPSGVVAPHLYSLPDYHELNDDRFINLLKKIGFKSSQVLLENEDVKKLLLPITRSDLTLAANYAKECSGQCLLDIPIIAFCGEDDMWAAESGINQWKNYTTKNFTMITLPDKHFFIESQQEKILTHLHNVINRK